MRGRKAAFLIAYHGAALPNTRPVSVIPNHQQRFLALPSLLKEKG